MSGSKGINDLLEINILYKSSVSSFLMYSVTVVVFMTMNLLLPRTSFYGTLHSAGASRLMPRRHVLCAHFDSPACAGRRILPVPYFRTDESLEGSMYPSPTS